MPRTENVDLEIDEKSLPPMLQKMIGELRSDRKMLLKDKAYQDPTQLRAFLAQYTFQRLTDIVKVFGQAFVDTYALSISNAEEQKKLRRFVLRELNDLGADVDADDIEPSVSVKTLDELHQRFYALGSLLQKELPDNQIAQDTFNACADLLSQLMDELTDREPDDDDEDDDRDDDGEEASASDESEAEAEAPTDEAPADAAAEPESDDEQPQAD